MGARLTSFVPLALLILRGAGRDHLRARRRRRKRRRSARSAASLLAAAYRSLTWTKLKESVFLTARTSAMVCWLFVGSFIFSAVFAALGGDDVIKDFVVGAESVAARPS